MKSTDDSQYKRKVSRQLNMIADKYNDSFVQLIVAFERFIDTVQRAVGKEKVIKSNTYYSYRRREDYYLHNERSTYKIERRQQKNLPYQRRNY